MKNRIRRASAEATPEISS